MKHTKAFGWAWYSPEFGLCHWAEPDKDRLKARSKPSPECIPVRVQLVSTKALEPKANEG